LFVCGIAPMEDADKRIVVKNSDADVVCILMRSVVYSWNTMFREVSSRYEFKSKLSNS